ncbi:unnamed protein product [Absidia cylindrospora]
MGSGNDGFAKNDLQNKTILYSPNNNTWTTIATPPSTVQQAFALSSVIDTNGMMWLYGGVIAMDNRTMVLDSLYNDMANSTNVTLPTQLYGLNTKTWQWTTQDLPTQYDTRADHGAAITSDNKMYIIGGMTIKTNVPSNQSRSYVPMDQILIFDTINQSWTQINSKGRTPTPRRAFTMDYLPSQNQFVIYGGVYDSGNRSTGRNVSADICYTLNVSTTTWTLHDVQTSNTGNQMGAGQIYGHSSILYDDKLYLIFGVDEQREYRDDINILNTLTWKWEFQNGTPPNIWTTGALIGLVFGIVAGILLILGLFYYLKRRAPDNPPSDQFVIDSTDDPRLRIDVDPIYNESTRAGDPTVVQDTMTRSGGDDSTSEKQQEKQQQNQNRHLSGATLLGSLSLAKGMTHRPLSSMSQCVTDSTFTSFSGTTATKPDLVDPPPPTTPTSPLDTPINDRNKPDGDD